MSADFRSLRARLDAAYQRGAGAADAARNEAVLQERRQTLAGRQLDATSREILASAFVFRRGSVRVGVPLTMATEVRQVEVSSLPGSGAHVNGLFQIRGRCIALVDLAPFFGSSTRPQHGESCLVVVVHGARGDLGLRIDEILDVRTIHVDELEPNLGDSRLPFVHHITRDGVHVVDVEAITAAPELYITGPTAS
jgi:chemotaxis signal transduction protein